jgi:DNA-binding NtrC family response regulator
MRSQRNYRVLIIDDDREMRQSLEHLLGKAGLEVESLSDALGAVGKLESMRPDVILSDVRMPGRTGLQLLSDITSVDGPPVVLISAHADIPMAVEAIQQGAYSFLEKPFDPRRLLTILDHAAEKKRLTADTRRLRERLSSLAGLDRLLLGESEALRNVRELVLDYSQTDATIMITGETGTGKELVARALHDLSHRANGPFVAINCAAIPLDKFEESMFGVKGQTLGSFRQADAGTLFLDEITACTSEVQAKLLRAIETREVTPVGADHPVSVDARIVSAAGEEPEAAVAAGHLRGDLMYRLNNVMITLPSLRDRKDDIPMLFDHFLQSHATLYEIAPPEMSAEDFAMLMVHDWPGNVRELRNVAERRVLSARRGGGSVAKSMQAQDDIGDVPETLREAVAAFERTLIAKALQTHKGRMDATAEALGIGRRTLNEKIVKLGLNKSELL